MNLAATPCNAFVAGIILIGILFIINKHIILELAVTNTKRSLD